MTNLLPDTTEEINAEYKKLVDSKSLRTANSRRKDLDRKQASAIFDGDETTSIDKGSFDERFDQFKLYIETRSKEPFFSFSENSYLNGTEGYKAEVYEKARAALSLADWKKEDVGTGNIFKHVVSAIRLDKTFNNLLDWRLADKFEKKAKKDEIKKYEEILFDFYLDQKSDEDSVADFVQYFGKDYPLIGYLFFIKNKELYVPINPNRFDVSFKKLGVKGFKTNGRCSWKNYHRYNDLIRQVQELLKSRGIRNVSLLDAHTFTWMIYDDKEDLMKNHTLTK